MTEWYERNFGQDYLLVYKHRDPQEAVREVHKLIEWLKLPASASVLDLCCGMGRHSLALAQLGYRVTGVDLSEVLLRAAIQHDTDHKVTFLRSDMRQLPIDGPFDAVVNLFTSFGYFANDSDNEQVFHEISRVLSPSGRFIIDFLNPAYVEQHLVPISERHDEGTTIKEYRQIEQGFVKKDITLTDDSSGEKRHYEERVKLYRLADFHAIIASAGLFIDAIYGDYDGSSYKGDASARLIMVGSRCE